MGSKSKVFFGWRSRSPSIPLFFQFGRKREVGEIETKFICVPALRDFVLGDEPVTFGDKHDGVDKGKEERKDSFLQFKERGGENGSLNTNFKSRETLFLFLLSLQLFWTIKKGRGRGSKRSQRHSHTRGGTCGSSHFIRTSSQRKQKTRRPAVQSLWRSHLQCGESRLVLGWWQPFFLSGEKPLEPWSKYYRQLWGRLF